MQYILNQSELNHYKEIEEKYNDLVKDIESIKEDAKKVGYREGLISFSIDAFRKLVYNSDGSFKEIERKYLWKPIDGHTYFNGSAMTSEFRKILENSLKSLGNE